MEDTTQPVSDPRSQEAGPPPLSETETLRRELVRTASERDMLLHLMLRSNSTMLGRLGQRWAHYTSAHPSVSRWISRPARLLWLLLTLRWPAGLRVNPLFDEAWYREQYADAPKGRRAAYRQYLRLALSKERDPNPHFDTAWYVEHNPDVRAGRWQPIDHYLYFGWREARNPSADFDGFEYLRHHPDAVEQAMNPLLHSMRASPFELADPGAVRLPGPPPALQRTVTYFQRYGVRRTASRVATELGWAESTTRSSGSLAELSIDQVDARRITAHLDTPRPGATEGASTLLVSGWAFSDRSELSASVYLDGILVIEATTGRARPDVAALHRGAANARTSGFSARLSIESTKPGEHIVHVVLRDGPGAVRVLSEVFVRADAGTMYDDFYRRSLPTPEESALARTATLADGPPHIHLFATGQDDPQRLRTMRSIEAQSYPNLTVVDVDQGFGLPQDIDRRRLIGFLQSGETLATGALWRLARRSQQPGVELVYADHDSVDETGRHIDPWFVPDWSPDHILAQDFVGGFYLVRDSESVRATLAACGDPTAVAWRYGLLLALTREERKAVHLEGVTWSRPARDLAASGRPQAEEAVVRAELAMRAADAPVRTIHDCPVGAIRHIEWPVSEPPLVSIIIPTTGRLEFVQQAMASLERTDYPNREVIFLDNSRGRHSDGIDFLRSQDVTVLERDEPFNWAKLNNDGVRAASGSLLLFLNDDVEAMDPEWLTAMVRQASRAEVGAVGAVMHYPDGTIQHAGVFLVGHGGGAMHLFRGMDPDEDLYLDWHRVTRDVTAVTGACMMVPRAVFDQIGGFDEDLAIAGNDVDLCLRAARAGKRVVLEAQSVLIHHESRSRAGVDHFADEGRMWDRWSALFSAGDAHYNPNLSEERVDASLEWDRVAGRTDPILRADPSSGVNLVGYIRAEMGLGEALRGEARALTAAGIPFVVIDHQGGTPARLEDTSWVHKITDGPVFDTNILHINPDLLPQALDQLPKGLTRGRRNIGVWTWELPEFPEEWRGSFSLVDEVWVPSTFVRDAIGPDAPVPVHVVPHAVRTPHAPFLGREHFGLPADAFQFLAMYDTQSVMERKNPQGAVEAFKRAFGPHDAGVSLVLKVNSAGDREVASLRKLIDGHSNIHLVTDTLSRHAVDSLMVSSDAFVSLHRAEGFGLPIAEAMALGVPVIATGWSGNMDFMSSETAACVSYELVELERSFGPYEAGQRWAEPDLADAAMWMGRFRGEPDLVRSLSEVALARMGSSDCVSGAGRTMAARLGIDTVG